MDAKGDHPLLSMGNRKERRRREKAAKKLSERYRNHLVKLLNSGARFPVDQFLRQLTIEYTHRYASSGTNNQPTSFNYFEPFLHFKLFPDSVAPYPELCREHDHLFSSADFFDYLTGGASREFSVAQLLSLPDAEVFHFTTNGDILDLTFLGPDQREFVISGFSIIRRGDSLHWFLVGGQVFTGEEWEVLCADQMEIDLQHIAPWKRAFLKEAIDEHGGKGGAPVPLEGTATVRRTILCGEFELTTAMHLGRCIMHEAENSFAMFCDDPEVIVGVTKERGDKIISSMMAQVSRAGSMWNLAEALLQLPHYFQHRERLSGELLGKAGKRISLSQKGGRGPGAQFKVVPALEVVKDGDAVVRQVFLPHYATETEGHWRRLRDGSVGRDRLGNPIAGKTWVSASSRWRDLEKNEQVIYVKDRIASAKLKISEIIELAEKVEATQPIERSEQSGTPAELYVLRCSVMEDQVYKVGWTSGAASKRAAELSRETGVPLAFVVVKSWQHPDAEALETEAHMMLSPYRLNDRREFFRVRFEVIDQIIEDAIIRAAARGCSGEPIFQRNRDAPGS
jgi:hypothetical protein